MKTILRVRGKDPRSSKTVEKEKSMRLYPLRLFGIMRWPAWEVAFFYCLLAVMLVKKREADRRRESKNSREGTQQQEQAASKGTEGV
jgi:predicted peroxiredoxin